MSSQKSLSPAAGFAPYIKDLHAVGEEISCIETRLERARNQQRQEQEKAAFHRRYPQNELMANKLPGSTITAASTSPLPNEQKYYILMAQRCEAHRLRIAQEEEALKKEASARRFRREQRLAQLKSTDSTAPRLKASHRLAEIHSRQNISAGLKAPPPRSPLQGSANGPAEENKLDKPSRGWRFWRCK